MHGLIRISAPTPFTHFRLIPFLLLFQKKYPNIHIDIHSSNRNIIFSEDNFDIAIRGQKPKDCNLIARKLEDSELIVVATPTYLQNMGIPVMLEDLKKHNCIEFELPSTGRKILWHFCKKGKPVELEIKGN
nr:MULTISPECIES: substrate binding domain-containing protein [unclassified Gilliamella]